MRVLFLSAGYPPLPGGGERYVKALADHLGQLGCQLTVVTSSAEIEADFWQGNPNSDNQKRIIRLPVKKWPGGRNALLGWRKAMVVLSTLPASTPLLSRMAQRIPPLLGLEQTLAEVADQIDLIHAFNISWEMPMVAGWRLAQSRNLPFVATPFAHFGNNPRSRVALNSMMRHQRALLADADAVLTLTSVEIDGLEAWGVRPKRIGVIGGGVDEPPMVEDGAVELAPFGLPEKFVLFIGRASFDKGAVHAVEAVARLRQQGDPVTLVLAGQKTADFERSFASLTTDEQSAIHHLGLVTEAQKHALLAHCQLLLLPSRSDSFGIVMLEAWAHGKPVVAANSGGIPGVVDADKDGLLVPFGAVPALANAIHTLLNDAELRDRLGANGKAKLAQKFSWSAVARQVKSVYEGLL